MAAADAAGTTDAEPACRVRFTANPRNPFSPRGSPGCLDGADNDGDGFVDYADPDCTAFSDNDESSFAIRTTTDQRISSARGTATTIRTRPLATIAASNICYVIR